MQFRQHDRHYLDYVPERDCRLSECRCGVESLMPVSHVTGNLTQFAICAAVEMRFACGNMW